MTEKLLELLNEAKDLLGKQPPAGQFDAYPTYLTCKDIQDILQVSKSKANSIMHMKGFPLIKLGKSLRVEREQFFKWLQKFEQQGA